eukprot:1146433-Pelagomonas_calceolata.AAC.12
MTELLDLLLAGVDQPQADQLNMLAEGLPGGGDIWVHGGGEREKGNLGVQEMADNPPEPH